MAKDEQFERLGRSTLAGELKLLLDGDAGIARGRRRSGRPVWDCIRNNGFLHRKSLSRSICQAAATASIIPDAGRQVRLFAGGFHNVKGRQCVIGHPEEGSGRYRGHCAMETSPLAKEKNY